jgi:hypothetical protein
VLKSIVARDCLGFGLSSIEADKRFKTSVPAEARDYLGCISSPLFIIICPISCA